MLAAGGEDERDDVIADRVGHVDRVDGLARLEDLLLRDDGFDVELRRGRRHRVEDLAFLLARRVADVELQHEAVDLGFGQRVGALLVDRVLRREDEEGRGELVGLAAERHLALLHRFEERRLHLGGRAVDLVREDEVGEDRAALHGVFAGLRIVDERAHDVGRQQVGRELDAREVGVDGLRERAHGQRLREAGHAFEEDVAVGEEADQQAIDEVLLADDDPGDLFAEARHPGAGGVDGGGHRGGEGARGVARSAVLRPLVSVRSGRTCLRFSRTTGTSQPPPSQKRRRGGGRGPGGT